MANEKRLIDAYVLAEEIELLEITVAGKPARWNDAKHSVLRVIAEQGDVDAVEIPDCKKCAFNDGIAYWHQCEGCIGNSRNNFVPATEVKKDEE